MRGINKSIIVGSLGADPEVRYSQSGSAMATISVATSESWKDKTTGEQQERTEWHRIKFFGKLAEIAGEYLKKGSHVYIEGKLRTEKYTDKNGVDKYSTDIIADEMQMLGGKPQDGERSNNSSRASAPAPRQNSTNNNGAGNNSNSNRGASNQGARQPANSSGGGGSGSFGNFDNEHKDLIDEDIPFLNGYGIY